MVGVAGPGQRSLRIASVMVWTGVLAAPGAVAASGHRVNMHYFLGIYRAQGATQ